MNKEKKINWKALVFAIAVPLLVGGVSGWLTSGSMEFYQTLEKPFFAPPGWVFPVVWTILYIMMGVASYFILISPKSQQKYDALRLYYFQLAVNFFWPIIFFNLQNIFASFWWLIVLLVLSIATLILFCKEDKRSCYLFLPYVVWLMFAAVLNLALLFMNG